MTKANYIQWLETQIVRAQELGGMDLEIWAFRQCLKKARDLGQELPIPDGVGQGEQFYCDCEYPNVNSEDMPVPTCDDCFKPIR